MRINKPYTTITDERIDEDVVIETSHVRLVGCVITGTLTIPQWIIDDPQSDVQVVNCSFNGFHYGNTFFGEAGPVLQPFLDALRDIDFSGL